MAAALAGCRPALVGTGWTISHLVSTNGCKKTLFSPCRGTIAGTVGSFQSEGAFAGRSKDLEAFRFILGIVGVYKSGLNFVS